MKRLLAVFLAAILLGNLAGCGQPDAPEIRVSPVPSPEESLPGEETTASGEETTASGEPEPSVPESSEPSPPPTLPEPSEEDFVRILDYIPTARVELPYATVNNFTGCRIYDFTDAYLRYGTVKKLMQVSGELAGQGIGLIVWDGFRPVSAQAKLWEICPDPAFVSHPVTGKRAHCRGNTVDVSLYDLETGAELPVPTGYDNFTAYADRDYSDCSAAAAANARLLEQTMEKYGFTPYFAEWWHFTDTTDYPVDEFFDPAVPATWSANCSEYISLRSAPGGEVIARIPKGATMTLQGWDGRYAEVCCQGRTGYVLSSYILPEEKSYFDECLDTVTLTGCYSYDRMVADMAQLQSRYPDVVSVGSIGTSELGRDIPVICIGSLSARYHVLLQGAIHGREHMTACLMMAMADYWLDHGILGYGDVCYHMIPMVNPDGVILSQTGILDENQQKIYLQDRENGYTTQNAAAYAALWKANGLGIDLNRNFPAGWEEIDERTGPSSQQYRGSAPFSAAEAAALRDYTLKYDFDATISYHTAGSVIYYAYGDREPVNARSLSLAKKVQEISGYDLLGSEGVDGAGYKDWVMDTLGIPSLTVEIGCAGAVLEEREIYSIFVRNIRLLPAIARWLQIPS